jgi:hypothetical protein
MDGAAVSLTPLGALAPVHRPSPWARVWEVVSDLLIATVLIWTLPIVMGVTIAKFAADRWRGR